MYGYQEGPRDRVAVQGDVVRYLLWGNEIANWNVAKKTLIVDDCGWQTQLTMNRLNDIMRRLGFSIYSERGSLYLHDWRRDETYVWEGSHIINLETRRVNPCTPRTFNEKISNSLKRYYEKAKKMVEKRGFLVTVTLDGVIYAFVNKWSGGITRRTLVLQVFEDGFKAYQGFIAASKIYSAFVKGNAGILMKHLRKEGYEIDGAENLLRELEDYGVDLNTLPEHVVSKLALAKLLEG
jgi:hypothetical protein